jgi:transcriptional regulator with XRE-family HTH domain
MKQFNSRMDNHQLRAARKRIGWSQQKAAGELGVSQSYLSMLERGERPLSAELTRRMVRAYGLPPTALPPAEEGWTPTQVFPQSLAEGLAQLGYPGFGYLRSRRRKKKNPAEILLTALSQENLEARLVEALPWLLLKYWDMDAAWLVRQAKLHDLQNRLGFVVTLARRAGQESRPTGTGRDAALARLESVLAPSRLAREDVLGKSPLSAAERTRLKTHRSADAKQWNLLTDWRPEALRYVP